MQTMAALFFRTFHFRAVVPVFFEIRSPREDDSMDFTHGLRVRAIMDLFSDCFAYLETKHHFVRIFNSYNI